MRRKPSAPSGSLDFSAGLDREADAAIRGEKLDFSDRPYFTGEVRPDPPTACFDCGGGLQGNQMRCPACVGKAWDEVRPRAISLLDRLELQRPGRYEGLTSEDLETNEQLLKKAHLASEGQKV